MNEWAPLNLDFINGPHHLNDYQPPPLPCSWYTATPIPLLMPSSLLLSFPLPCSLSCSSSRLH